MQSADPNHVTTLLVVRVRVEQVVADILQNSLDGFAGHLRDRRIGVGGGGHVHQPLAVDDLPREQGRTPTEARRERNLGTLHVHQGVKQKLVAGAIEVSATVQGPLSHGQFLGKFFRVGRSYFLDQCFHVLVGGKHVGKHRQQLVAVVHHFLALDLKVHDRQKLAVRAGIGHQRLATFVAHHAGHGHAVVRVAAHDRIDAADAAGHFQVNVHAVVGQQHHDLSPLRAGFIHDLLHVFVLDAEGPVGNHITRVGNRGVGKRLTDDGARNAIDFAHHIRLENLVAEVVGLDVLRHEFDFPGEVLVNDFLDTLHAVGEFPVTRHDVHTEQFAGIHHVLAIGPQGRAGTLPGVAAVQEEGTGPACPELFDQGGQVCETADLAIALGCFFEVKAGQRMRLRRTRANASRLEQVFTNQVGQLPLHGAHAQVDAGLTEVTRHQLRMAIGHVQKRHIAETRGVVKPGAGRRGVCIGPRAQAHSCHGAGAQHLKKLAFT